MYQFLAQNASNSIKQISDYAVDDFNANLFYQILESQGVKLMERCLLKQHYKLMKDVVGSVLWCSTYIPVPHITCMNFTGMLWRGTVG